MTETRMAFSEFMLSGNITAATRQKNEWIFRKIEVESENSLIPVFALLFQTVAITGARLSECLKVKCSDIDFDTGLLKIYRTRENALKLSGQKNFQIDLIRYRRKEGFYISGDKDGYIEADRMTRSEIEKSLTPEENFILSSICYEAGSVEIIRFLPGCLLKKLSHLTQMQDGYVFRREFTNSNRVKNEYKNPVSRQSAWRNISALQTYNEYIAKGGLGIMGVSEPLMF